MGEYRQYTVFKAKKIFFNTRLAILQVDLLEENERKSANVFYEIFIQILNLNELGQLYREFGMVYYEITNGQNEPQMPQGSNMHLQ